MQWTSVCVEVFSSVIRYVINSEQVFTTGECAPEARAVDCLVTGSVY